MKQNLMRLHCVFDLNNHSWYNFDETIFINKNGASTAFSFLYDLLSKLFDFRIPKEISNFLNSLQNNIHSLKNCKFEYPK